MIESLQIDLHSTIQDGLSTTGMATEAQVSLFSLFLRLEHDIEFLGFKLPLQSLCNNFYVLLLSSI